MDRVIFKYEIPIANQFDLLLPVGFIIRKLEKGKGAAGLSHACLWIEHVKDVYTQVEQGKEAHIQDKEHVFFRFYGTGHTITANNHKYVGTLSEGRYVWHLYEVTK